MALSKGVLLNLLKGMSTVVKPTSQHRSSLVQVTEIVPANLDHKCLFPQNGFHIKVSDSLHSIYVTLPSHQDDLVLSNKLQLGQFMYVDRLEPGSPVPVVILARLLQERHPIMGTPEELMIVREKEDKIKNKWNPAPKRVSWESRKNGFDVISPSGGGHLLARIKDAKGESYALLGKSFADKSSRSMSDSRKKPPIPPSLFKSNKKKNRAITPQGLPNAEETMASPVQPVSSNPSVVDSNNLSPPLILPENLTLLSKQAMQQVKVTRKIALQALREASATETLIRSLKMFSNLCKTAQVDTPAACFERFLKFHCQIAHALSDMESILAATSASEIVLSSNSKQNEEESHALRETVHNSNSGECPLSKSIADIPIKKDHKTNKGKLQRSNANQKENLEKKGPVEFPQNPVGEHKEKKKPESSCRLSNTIKLGKQIETEAGNWFMEFIENVLETSLKKTNGAANCDAMDIPQSLLLQILNWVEVEQCDSNKRPVHPKAAQVAGKLTIKINNPCK